eukprot:GHVR01124415.1.p1 GENE.GHVR01124415.1~~GHVR01124415.1.p1  ORF type:complete len:373 (-),score=0.94 GHVR01124415.1:370-1344(-)
MFDTSKLKSELEETSFKFLSDANLLYDDDDDDDVREEGTGIDLWEAIANNTLGELFENFNGLEQCYKKEVIIYLARTHCCQNIENELKVYRKALHTIIMKVMVNVYTPLKILDSMNGNGYKWLIVMKDVSTDGLVVTKDILRNNWKNYWKFIKNLAGGTMLTGTIYFDLRPKMTNVRFYEDDFILLDLESFQQRPRDNLNRYPISSVGDLIWTLWQSITCVYCVSRNCAEDQVYNKPPDDQRNRTPLRDMFPNKSLASYIYHRGVTEDTFDRFYQLQLDECVLPGGFEEVFKQLENDPVMNSWVEEREHEVQYSTGRGKKRQLT